jgi:hypothetical protein
VIEEERIVKLRRWAAPLAVLPLLTLSACGDLPTGTAATVNGSRITMEQVDDLAEAQCSAAESAARTAESTSMAISRVRQQSLGVLMDTELSRQYAEDEGITPSKEIADGFYGQFEPGIEPLPEETREVLTEVFEKWALSRAVLVEAGSRETGQDPDVGNVEELVNAGLSAREPWLQDVEINTDPRFSPAANGFPGGGDGSVSRPSSQAAKDATASEPDPAWLSGLPASLKCG